MPKGLPADQPQVCACPGCDEVVVQRDPGSVRLYHSDECRRKARRLRRGSRAADTADLSAAAATPGRPAAELAPAPELAAAEVVAPAEPAAAELPGTAAELPGTAELPGGATGHDAVLAREDHGGTDAAEDPGDSEFWKSGAGEADGFWDADQDSPRNDARSPGRHRSPASQGSRLRRSHAAAIALTLAASAAGLGLIFSQPGTRHPPASEAQLPAPPAGTQPASSSSSSPAGPARTRHGHAAGGTSPAPRPPATRPSPAPSPTSPRTRPSPKPSASRKPASPAPSGLISFEDGTDGWSALWGSISASRSTQVAYSGSHSLLITIQGTIGGLGVDNGTVAHLRSGDTVTFHVYSNGQNASVEPFVQESSADSEDVAESVQLPSQRGWFNLNWVVPSVSSVYAIGMQVTNHGSGQITLAIDALTWPGS
jgi:hypothetical protein